MFPTSRELSLLAVIFSIAVLALGVAAVLAFAVLPSVLTPELESPVGGAPPSVAKTPAVAGAGVGEVVQRPTSLGPILVNATGHTLYAFTRDSHDTDRCILVNGCTNVWPIATAGSVRAGRGVHRSLLGAITLPGGTRQVTYAGHPLYTYVGDSAPGQVDYVGVSQSGGRWPAIRASGALLP